MGAAVSHLPWDTWKIFRLPPVSASSLNGNGMRRSRDENSSLDSWPGDEQEAVSRRPCR